VTFPWVSDIVSALDGNGRLIAPCSTVRPKGTNQMLELVIQLIAGALGGNLAGALLKNQSLGTLGNSLAGIVGGGLGGQILTMLSASGAATDAAAAMATSGLDIGSIISSVAGGGVGGGVLMVVVGLIKSAMSKT